MGIVSLLVICALSVRFRWSSVPWYISLLGDVLVALGLFVNYLVFKENSFGGSTIETSEDQKVISTGLYAHIRHPMYAGVLIMMIGVPLALGSYWGLVVLAIILPGLIWRILDEERSTKKGSARVCGVYAKSSFSPDTESLVRRYLRKQTYWTGLEKTVFIIR